MLIVIQILIDCQMEDVLILATQKKILGRNSYTHWYNLLKAHLELHGVNQAPSSLRLRFRLYPEKNLKKF